MSLMKRALLLLLLATAACGEAVKDDHFADDVKSERPEAAPVSTEAVPVRIGELGANFNACGAVGTTRHLGTDPALAVRSAPFETAAETGRVAANARFFVCARSHDQRWLGIVYEASGILAPACGVSAPVTSRRAYDGPCASGWVPSAFVKLVAG